MLRTWFSGTLIIAFITVFCHIEESVYMFIYFIWTFSCVFVAIKNAVAKRQERKFYRNYNKRYKEYEKQKEKYDPEMIPDDYVYIHEISCSYRPLLTENEKIFFEELYRQCIIRDFHLFTKVRLEDLLSVNASNEFERERQRSKIKSRHVDFVVCDKSLRQIMAFELDDSSHNSDDAKKTDALKDEVFRQIGIPLYRISTNDDYWVVLDKIFKKY